MNRNQNKPKVNESNTDVTAKPSNPFAGGGIAAAAAQVAMKRNQKTSLLVGSSPVDASQSIDNEYSSTTSDSRDDDSTGENTIGNMIGLSGIAAAAAQAALLRMRSVEEKKTMHDVDSGSAQVKDVMENGIIDNGTGEES